MRERDLIKLEFFQVLERLKAYVHSKATERFIDQIRPITDRQLLEENISLVKDFAYVWEEINLYKFDDVEDLIKRSSIKDYTLSVEEALSLLKVLRLIKEVRKALGERVQAYKNLAQITK
ncbi:MAG: endonuclease MutS2, partial [Aquificaceae bacterium]